MADLKDIQREIKSVSSTQKTTRAMKLVSTAKLRRAEELAKRSRLFSEKINELIAEVAGRIKCHKANGISNRAFKPISDPKVIDIIFVTADKGLCGGFNHQTLKAVSKLMAQYEEKNVKIRLRGIGKKGVEYYRYNNVEMLDEVIDLSSKPNMDRSNEFIEKSLKDFKEGLTDSLYIVYNGYKNMLTQEMHINQLLPIDPDQFHCSNPLMEPLLKLEAYDHEKMLESLVNKYIQNNMFYALIDSIAAEHSARMQAMDAATNNAKEMVKTLNVKYNKARQAAITTELIEIISGVEAMK
jgi:F-type H+-transporting ATPase subunit gamma